jgi:hypothetical protein
MILAAFPCRDGLQDRPTSRQDLLKCVGSRVDQRMLAIRVLTLANGGSGLGIWMPLSISMTCFPVPYIVRHWTRAGIAGVHGLCCGIIAENPAIVKEGKVSLDPSRRGLKGLSSCPAGAPSMRLAWSGS